MSMNTQKKIPNSSADDDDESGDGDGISIEDGDDNVYGDGD